MSDPNYAEWRIAIRELERRAAELASPTDRLQATQREALEAAGVLGPQPAGVRSAILLRCAKHMRRIGPPRPPMLNRSEWSHVDQLVADAFARARGAGDAP